MQAQVRDPPGSGRDRRQSWIYSLNPLIPLERTIPASPSLLSEIFRRRFVDRHAAPETARVAHGSPEGSAAAMRNGRGKGVDRNMETIDDKIERLSPEIYDPRLAEHEAEWMTAFAARGKARPNAAFTSSGAVAVAMALVIGMASADLERFGRAGIGAPAEERVMTPFSLEMPLAPSTLLAE